jgi:hypothetical protein
MGISEKEKVLVPKRLVNPDNTDDTTPTEDNDLTTQI